MGESVSTFDWVGIDRGEHRPSDRTDTGRPSPSAGLDPQFTADVYETSEECLNVLFQRHHDYGPKNISNSPGGPLNGIQVRLWDKVARLNHLTETGAAPQSESVRDSWIDICNYATIALMCIDKTWPGTQ